MLLFPIALLVVIFLPVIVMLSLPATLFAMLGELLGFKP